MAVEHAFFRDFAIRELNLANFDEILKQHEPELVGIFFWGHDCPNCEVAKNILHDNLKDLSNLGLTWFHVNTYENFDLGTRFGLFGIPTFLFFKGGKKLGKISPFPGSVAFFEALRTLKVKVG